MSLDNLDYKNMTDYLARLYQRQPFVRHGMAHPVTVFYPSESQTHDVDSLLDPWLPTPEERDFAVYDYSYLHDSAEQQTQALQRLDLHPETHPPKIR